ncbi:Crp/Fnr family transcriptional regulator [Dethiothermospora halolimnae]|uniref:Crp/Fnr family transcriptional regulator n=1 Tax=Dethiothermospora halolimnae TaxID=3114390 RepID=UPI003CCBBBF3
MKKINDKKLLNYYIKKHNMDDILDKDIIPYMELHYYEKGEQVLIPKSNLLYYYFFIDGKLKIFSLLENGKSILLEFYTTFDTLGDVELLKDRPIVSNVEAVKDSYLIGIPTNILRKKCYNNPRFLRFMISSLSKKLENTSNNSCYNLSYPLINRLSSYLLEHITDKDYIILNSTFNDISEFLGTTYRHLHRTFKKLENNRVIRFDDGRIYILNKGELRRLSKNLYR